MREPVFVHSVIKVLPLLVQKLMHFALPEDLNIIPIILIYASAVMAGY